MDIETIRRNEKKILDLFEEVEKDIPGYHKIQSKRILKENEHLYEHFSNIVSVAYTFLGKQGDLFSTELFTAYNIIEEISGEAIHPIERKTIDDFLDQKRDPNEELKNLKEKNPSYHWYVQVTWDHWKKSSPNNKELAPYLARHLIFLHSLAEMQKERDDSRTNH